MSPLNRKPRRGVLLLVVLSLLVLFVLAGISFVAVTGQYRRGTVALSKIERIIDVANDPKVGSQLTESSLDQLLTGGLFSGAVGANGADLVTSNLAPHSLLYDLYGNDSVHGWLTSGQLVVPPQFPPTGGSVWQLKFNPNPGPGQPRLKPIEDYYDGRVLTILTGKLAGKSARILDYNARPGADGSWGQAGNDDDGNGTVDDPSDAGYGDDEVALYVAPIEGKITDFAVNDEFLINGGPFNGVGAGLVDASTTTANLQLLNPLSATHNGQPAGSGGYPIALLPNYAKILQIPSFTPNPTPTPLEIASLTTKVFGGGGDESWDAVDFQNLMMARVAKDPTQIIIPSFHRPELILFWYDWLRQSGRPLESLSETDAQFAFQYPFGPDGIINSGDNEPSLSETDKRELFGLVNALTFRPPNVGDFARNNPQFSLFQPKWDVDNDGDGIADSVWIDIGLPKFTNADGTTFRPLVAILCTDLDGRINLNTMGTDDFATGSVSSALAASAFDSTAVAGPTGPTPTGLEPLIFIGEGYGAAEINPAPFLPISDYTALVAARYKSLDPSDTVSLPGVSGVDDWISPYKTAGLHNDWQSLIPPLNAQNTLFRSPPNLNGYGATVLNHVGQPIRLGMGQPGERVDDPYEFDPLFPRRVDSPFTDADFEPLLRPYDGDDDNLSQRMQELVGSFTADPRMGLLFTARSVDIPYPQMQLTAAQRAKLESLITSNGGTYYSQFLGRNIDVNMPSSHLLDYVYVVLESNGVASSEIPLEAKFMLPLEILRGQKMNLNRLFGDGVDSDGDLLVDELDEQLPGLTAVDFARQLYCLAMFLRNPDAVQPDEAKLLAQWAINVVEFRDPDVIMTKFDYDDDPYDGWDVTGDYVWGCERPELLITETLAWHDRRTEDTDQEIPGTEERDAYAANNMLPMDDGMSGIPGPGKFSFLPGGIAGGDMSFDQIEKPRGAFFVELYNPWNGTELSPPELCDALPPPGSNGVRLDRRNPGGDPVWRIVIARTLGAYAKDQEPPEDAVAIDRSVYFVDPQSFMGTAPTDDGVKYFTTATLDAVAPGGYAVVGGGKLITDPGDPDYTEPSDPLDPNYNPTYVGYAGDLDPAMGGDPVLRRRVLLRPNPNPTADPPQYTVEVPSSVPAGKINDNRGHVNLRDIPQPVAVPIVECLATPGVPHPLTVSEPAAGYSLTLPQDRPLDVQLNDATTAQIFMRDGTHENFAAVYLQRLADPTKPHNDNTNPYLTVDQMPVDLTVFNGLDTVDAEKDTASVANDNASAVEFAAHSDAGTKPNSRFYRFASNQRGNDKKRLLWPAEDASAAPVVADEVSAELQPAPRFFPYNLDHTLGYLNGGRDRNTGEYLNYWPIQLIGFYSGQPDTENDPSTFSTFMWLTWNDRPYANHLELLLVPKSSSANLLDEVTPDNILDNTTEYSLADGASPFGHLLNLFGNRFVELLDYVEVPSRFEGVETWLGNGTNTTPPYNFAAFGYPEGLHNAPTYRVPGRINLNTLNDPEIWQAIQENAPELSDVTHATDFLLGRWNIPETRPTWQTLIAGMNPVLNPLRSAASYNLMPRMDDPVQAVEFRQSAAADATVLRKSTVTANTPLMASVRQDPYRDAERNPYFRYGGLTRLGNMVSHNSNVFAIWVTVGYFEVQDVEDVDDAGTKVERLGKELGYDTGRITRHRSFYLVDRSIPVPFELGKGHDARKMIVLQRRLQ